jgi:hypothetical protein
MAMHQEQERRIGTGPGCSVASLIEIWQPVRFAAVAPCASLPPFFRHCVGGGSLATFTQESVITRILRHLKLASVPPPIAPARLRQEIFVFDNAHAGVGS